MLNLESGDRIELFYEDAPATTIRATVGRLLSDREEGMGIEAEYYVVCWIEISVDEPSDMDASSGKGRSGESAGTSANWIAVPSAAPSRLPDSPKSVVWRR